MFRARDEFKQERLPVETRIARGSALGSELVDWQRHIRDGGCEWWRTSRQSETLQNSLGRIRWMDGRENFHRAAADSSLPKSRARFWTTSGFLHARHRWPRPCCRNFPSPSSDHGSAESKLRIRVSFSAALLLPAAYFLRPPEKLRQTGVALAAAYT